MDRYKVYQILVVNKTLGISAIIPDRYCYDTIEAALVDVERRRQVFTDAGEKFEYKGKIRGLGDIKKIYNEHDKELETNECYIYELDIKTEYDGSEPIIDK